MKLKYFEILLGIFVSSVLVYAWITPGTQLRPRPGEQPSNFYQNVGVISLVLLLILHLWYKRPSPF